MFSFSLYLFIFFSIRFQFFVSLLFCAGEVRIPVFHERRVSPMLYLSRDSDLDEWMLPDRSLHANGQVGFVRPPCTEESRPPAIARSIRVRAY